MSSSLPTRRRFQPQPFETTTRSSNAATREEAKKESDIKDDSSAMAHEAKRLKADAEGQAREVPLAQEKADQDVDEAPLLPNEKALKDNTKPARRKFAVEHVETTTRSRKAQDAEPPTSEPSAKPSTARRRFAPEVIGTSTRSNRNQGEGTNPTSPKGTPAEQSPQPSPARRRFAPEVVSTSARSSRPESSIPDASAPASSDDAPKKPKRRFKVEMIETASRSRRSGDTEPTIRPEDKTNGTQSRSFKIERPPINPLAAPHNTPANSSTTVPLAQLLKPNPNRQGSMHPHYTTRANTRQHSFKVPDLEAIESSESSREGSRKSTHSSQDAEYKDATRMRESVDDRFSGYLLALAARAAEKQLRDQEAAVYPTADTHEQIMHYVDHEDSSDEPSPKASQVARPEPSAYRRDSDDDAAALQAMRRRGEKQYEEQRRNTRKKTGAFNVEFDAEAAQDAWMANAPKQQQAPNSRNVIGGYQQDPDLKQMRKAASPPMLGGDIDFPRCPSPDHARFDVTQGSEYLRNSMCYLNNQASPEGLWGGAGERKPSTASQSSGKSQSSGLWGGHCTSNDQRLGAAPTGIVTPQRTPAVEKDDPFQTLFSGSATGLSVAGSRRPPYPTPPSSNSGGSNASAHSIALVSQQETILEKEFPDSFVTQVYNYLSLGFPALATKFDDELSKISGVPVTELRKDDKLAEHRGYLRLGEHEVDVPATVPARSKAEKDVIQGEEEEMDDAYIEPVKEEMCARWRALRVYVREWGKQMGVAEENGAKLLANPHRAWGIPARKGSWAG